MLDFGDRSPAGTFPQEVQTMTDGELSQFLETLPSFSEGTLQAMNEGLSPEGSDLAMSGSPLQQPPQPQHDMPAQHYHPAVEPGSAEGAPMPAPAGMQLGTRAAATTAAAAAAFQAALSGYQHEAGHVQQLIPGEPWQLLAPAAAGAGSDSNPPELLPHPNLQTGTQAGTVRRRSSSKEAFICPAKRSKAAAVGADCGGDMQSMTTNELGAVWQQQRQQGGTEFGRKPAGGYLQVLRHALLSTLPNPHFGGPFSLQQQQQPWQLTTGSAPQHCQEAMHQPPGGDVSAVTSAQSAQFQHQQTAAAGGAAGSTPVHWQGLPPGWQHTQPGAEDDTAAALQAAGLAAAVTASRGYPASSQGLLQQQQAPGPAGQLSSQQDQAALEEVFQMPVDHFLQAYHTPSKTRKEHLQQLLGHLARHGPTPGVHNSSLLQHQHQLQQMQGPWQLPTHVPTQAPRADAYAAAAVGVDVLPGAVSASTASLPAAGQPHIVPTPGGQSKEVPESIMSRISRRYADFDKLLALTPGSAQPQQHCRPVGTFTEGFCRQLAAAAPRAPLLTTVGMDAAVQVQQVQHAGDQNVAREASGYGRVGLDAGHVLSLETLFWCAHAVLKQRLQAGVTLPVDSSTYVTQLVDEFVDGIASMAQMLGAMHAMLQTPAMAALLTSGDDGPMSPTTASPGPASAAAAALSAPAVLPPSAAVPAAGAEQPVVSAPVAPDPVAAQLLQGQQQQRHQQARLCLRRCSMCQVPSHLRQRLARPCLWWHLTTQCSGAGSCWQMQPHCSTWCSCSARWSGRCYLTSQHTCTHLQSSQTWMPCHPAPFTQTVSLS